MISKKEAKYIQSLSDKKNRDQDGVFVAEGPKLVSELLAEGAQVKMIFTTGDTTAFSKRTTEVRKVGEAELQRLSHLEKANEVIGIFEKGSLPPLQFDNGITLALDGIQDPGNLGTIIRTADWFGITQIIASPDTADCYNNKVVQSTMGSICRVHIYYTDIQDILSTTQVPVFGALLEGKNMYNIGPLQKGILVIGNESKGIRSNIQPFIQQAITIPRIGNAESLNAAVATGILLAHLTRNA